MKTTITKTEQSNHASAEKLLICDTNLVIMMVLFKPEVMFSHVYTFGKIVIDIEVEREIARWLTKSTGAKYKKFGKDVLSLALTYCQNNAASFVGFGPGELERVRSAIDAIEDKFAMDEKGADTSDVDKRLLALARKHKCNLATQEHTLFNVAKKFIGESRVYSFGRLVDELMKCHGLSLDDFKSGIHSLTYFREDLRRDDQKLLEVYLNQCES